MSLHEIKKCFWKHEKRLRQSTEEVRIAHVVAIEALAALPRWVCKPERRRSEFTADSPTTDPSAQIEAFRTNLVHCQRKIGEVRPNVTRRRSLRESGEKPLPIRRRLYRAACFLRCVRAQMPTIVSFESSDCSQTVGHRYGGRTYEFLVFLLVLNKKGQCSSFEAQIFLSPELF